MTDDILSQRILLFFRNDEKEYLEPSDIELKWNITERHRQRIVQGMLRTKHLKRVGKYLKAGPRLHRPQESDYCDEDFRV